MTAPNTTPESDDTGNDGGKATIDGVLTVSKREAAYRQRAKTAEAELAELRQQFIDQDEAATLKIAGLQHAEIMRVASEHFTDPAADFLRELDYDDVLDDNGDLDTAALAAVIDTAKQAHPHWSKPEPTARNVRDLMPGNGRIGHVTPKADPLAAALRSQAQRARDEGR